MAEMNVAVEQGKSGNGDVAEKVSAPPAAERPEKREGDAIVRLHEMARELMRARNRKLIVEYLRLRRALR